jgi:hypothetical protein
MANFLPIPPHCVSQQSADDEKDLGGLPGKVNLNPPPEDGRCQCCGRHISELEPFGSQRDPVLGSCGNARLIKRFRYIWPPDKEARTVVERILREIPDLEVDGDKVREVLILEFGKEKGEDLYDRYRQRDCCIAKSWECKDCSCLDDLKYWDKREKTELRRQDSGINRGFAIPKVSGREDLSKQEWQPFQKRNLDELKGRGRLAKVDLLVKGEDIVAWKYVLNQ